MRRLLLALACAAALCAPASMAQGVPVAKRCSGSVKVHSFLAGSIRTTKVSCTAGKALIHSLLSRVQTSPSCRRAANRPPPTRGCVVSGYHCFRKRSPDYCATTSGKLVQWREATC
jgi:membrane-bound lytic murein transglycosylase B